MAELKKPIIINNFQEGMSVSSHFGFEEIRGLDVFTVPGEATVNYELTNASISSASGVDSQVVQCLNNITLTGGGPADYVLLNDGDVWSGATLAQIKADSFKHLTPYKGYLMASSASDDAVSAFDGASTWDDDFLSVNNADFMLASLDDKLYVSDSANKIYYTSEVAGQTFDPANSATFTAAAVGLTLPADMVIKSMVDLGTYIAIAANSKYDTNTAFIYLWDGESVSAANRVIINGGNVNSMIAKNNIIYCNVGNRGDWYQTTGSTSALFAKMPESFLTFAGNSITVGRNALDFNEKGNIIFGFTQTTGAANGTFPNGIFELNTDTGKISFDNILSVGVGTAGAPVAVEAVRYDSLGTYRVGFTQDSSTYGIDNLSSTKRINSYAAFITSPYYQLGSSVSDATIQLKGFEIHLTKNLPASCGVKMYYRLLEDAAWTQWGDTMTTATNIFWQTIALENVKNIQFKIELTTNNSTTTPTFLKALIY